MYVYKYIYIYIQNLWGKKEIKRKRKEDRCRVYMYVFGVGLLWSVLLTIHERRGAELPGLKWYIHFWSLKLAGRQKTPLPQEKTPKTREKTPLEKPYSCNKIWGTSWNSRSNISIMEFTIKHFDHDHIPEIVYPIDHECLIR